MNEEAAFTILGTIGIGALLFLAFRRRGRLPGPENNWVNDALGGTKLKSDQSKDTGARGDVWLRGGNS